MSRRIEVTVGSALFDEPEVLTVEETAPVRRAIRALRAACKSTGDGFVETHGSTIATSTEAEFLEVAANFIGGAADEIDAMLAKWRAPN